ncbi:protein MpHAT11 [Marchantia polymorpha subsp. ruderalis]
MATAVDRDQSHTTEDLYGVRWGRLKPVKTEHYTYYESFYLDGVEYRVNDAVYLHARDGPPYIAQIAKLRQNIVNRKRTMLVRWFFRPCELPPRLPDVDYSENSKEIFMAAGSQHTKSFQNPGCTIKKCTILCTANETWNRMPSAEEIAAADHVFDRAFDAVKLRFNRLDPSKESCGEFLRSCFIKEKLKVERSDRSGQEVKGNREFRKDVIGRGTNSGSQSNMVNVVGPRNQFSGLQADQTSRRVSSEDPTAVSFTERKAFQRSEGWKRSSGEMLDDQRPTNATRGDLKRSSKDAGHDIPTDSQKRRRLDSFRGTVQEKNAHVAGGYREIEKARLNSQTRDMSVLPRDRPSKIQLIDGNKFSERKHEGTEPYTSLSNRSNKTRINQVGGAREAAIPSRLVREGVPPPSTGKNRLADQHKSSRILETNLQSQPVRHHHSSAERARSSSLEHRRSEGAVREGPRDERHGAYPDKAPSLKNVRDTTWDMRQAKDVQMHLKHQHPKSTTTSSRTQYGPQVRGDRTYTEDALRPSAKVEKSRDNAEDEASRKLKPGPYLEDLFERPDRTSGRSFKASENHRSSEAVVSAPVLERAFSTGANGELYVPSKKIFKFSWDEKKIVEEAVSNGRALLLKNLDPYLNSVELEAILENVLDITCDVRILPPRCITCYKSAEAIVIVKKADIAEDVLRTLTENILTISENERPVLASRFAKPKESIENFHGFFNLENFGWKINASVEQKNAVSTSHCAQSNTVEYEMGLHWRLIQDRDATAWKTLEEEHAKDLQKLKGKYLKLLR